MVEPLINWVDNIVEFMYYSPLQYDIVSLKILLNGNLEKYLLLEIVSDIQLQHKPRKYANDVFSLYELFHML